MRGLSVGLWSAKRPARSCRSPPRHTPRLNWPTVYRRCQSRFDGCIRGSDGHRNISSGSNCCGITVDRLSKSSSASLPIADVAGSVAAAACISSRCERRVSSPHVSNALAVSDRVVARRLLSRHVLVRLVRRDSCRRHSPPGVRQSARPPTRSTLRRGRRPPVEREMLPKTV